MRHFNGLLLAGIIWAFFVLIYQPAKALDDFDLARYGPDDNIKVLRTDFIVKIVTYNNADRLNTSFEESSGTKLEKDQGIRGYATVRADEDVCFVHIIPAEIWDDREAMAIMGHEIYHCALAKHKDLVSNDDIKKKDDIKKEALSEEDIIEQLYIEDRLLELEWLKDEYKEMGIIIDAN